MNHLVWALLPKAPEVWNASRWGRAEDAMRSLGILHACHGLLEAAFTRWADSMATPGAEAKGAGIIATAPIEDFERPAAADAEGDQSNDQRGDNERHRKIAKAFVDSRRSFLLPAMAIVAQPLSALLRACMHAGGAKWEAAQRHALARETSQSASARRQYRITLAVEQTLEKRFFEQLEQAFGSELWAAMHPESRSVAMQATAFKMLSRAGAAVRLVLQHHHMLPPFTTFRLLGSPPPVHDEVCLPACLLDGWSKAFLEQHMAELTSPVALSKLAVIASVAQLDIAAIEVGHSRFRRSLCQGYATWRQDLQQAGANWCIREHLRREREMRQLQGRSSFSEKDSEGAKAADVKADSSSSVAPKARMRKGGNQSAGGGGPYRAFLRFTKMDMFDPATSAAYKALSVEEKARYAALGAEMAEGARARNSTGQCHQSAAKAAKRQAQRQAFDAHVAEAARCAAGGGPIEGVMALTAEGDCASILHAARMDKRIANAALRQIDDEMAATLVAFAQDRSESTSAALAAIQDRFKENSADFHLVPCSADFDTVEFVPDPRAFAERVVAAASLDRKMWPFLSSLETEWARKHANIMHDACKPIEAATTRRTQCQRAGLCLCKKTSLKKCVGRMSARIKAVFPRGTSERELLDRGCIVLCLSNTESAAASQHYWHVSICVWSPYMLGLHRLERVGCDEGGFIHLQATHSNTSM